MTPASTGPSARGAKTSAAGAPTSGTTQRTSAASAPVRGTKFASSSSPIMTAAPPSGAATSGATLREAVPEDEHVTYHYNTLGRRDPFQPLVGGFVGADVGGNAPPDVGGLTVVGIVWGAQDRFALVEDPRGNSLVLREGDKVMNGVVQRLSRTDMTVKLSADGQDYSVTIPLTRKGEPSK